MEEIFTYLFFPHNGRNIGAFVKKVHDGLFTFRIQEDFFTEAELYSISLDEAAKISNARGYGWSDTKAEVVDRNRFITNVYYENGKIHRANTHTREMVTIFPNAGFNFVVDLQKAVRESPDFPEAFKQNLRRVAPITSLDDYFKGLPTHIPLDEMYNRRYITGVIRLPGYLPENIRRA